MLYFLQHNHLYDLFTCLGNSLHKKAIMKKTIWLCLVLMMAVACKKNRPEPSVEPHPFMLYKDLADSGIVFGKIAYIDLDNNGEKDVLFSTQLVGDPVGQKDKKQWMATTSFNTNLPINSTEHIPVLRNMDSIPVNDFSAYTWFNASSILLSQKTITKTIPPYWEGDWKEATHRFVPIQLKKQGGLYNGWIEVSFSTGNEKLTLHKAAICKEADKSILAGK
jgi:hypothetical protein